MKQQILAMEVELTNVVKNQLENDVQISDTKVKLNSANTELFYERKKMISLQNQTSKMFKDTQLLKANLQDPKRLKESVSAFCKKYGGDKLKVFQEEVNPIDDIINQRQFLEKTIISLKTQLKKMEEFDKQNASKMQMENKFIINEMKRKS